jgi:hypothetical protein
LKSHDFNRISPLAFQPFPGIGSQEALDGLGHGRFGRRLPEAGRTGPGFCVENARGKMGKPFGKGSTFIFGGEVLETNQINLFVFNIYGFDIIYLSFLFCFICVFLFSLFIIIGGEQQK